MIVLIEEGPLGPHIVNVIFVVDVVSSDMRGDFRNWDYVGPKSLTLRNHTFLRRDPF